MAKDVLMFIMKETQGMVRVIFSSLKQMQIGLKFLQGVMEQEGAAAVSELSDEELQATGCTPPSADRRLTP